MSDVFYAGMIPFYLTSCSTWTEDFDGVVLFGWEENTNLRTVVVSNAGAAAQAINTSGGAGITDCATLSAPSVGMGEAVRIDPTPASLGQWIEITVADFFQLPGDSNNFRSEIQIFNFGNDPGTATPGGNFGYIRWESDVQRLTVQPWSQDSAGDFVATDPDPVVFDPYGGSTGNFTMRLDSYNDGVEVLSFNNSPLIAYNGSPDVPGPGFHQGITMWWDVQHSACAATSPRILSARGGELC